MKQRPLTISEHISNARYYLEAADKLPPPTQDAAHILLLLIGWENIVIADEELSAWANDKDVDEKVYKSHAAKYKGNPGIQRVIVGSRGTPAKEVKFESGRRLEELRLACQYGSNTETKEVRDLFSRGWHTGDFRNGLQNKIEWVEMIIEAYKKLDYT